MEKNLFTPEWDSADRPLPSLAIMTTLLSTLMVPVHNQSDGLGLLAVVLLPKVASWRGFFPLPGKKPKALSSQVLRFFYIIEAEHMMVLRFTWTTKRWRYKPNPLCRISKVLFPELDLLGT
jgi:hypothetical protein